MIEAELPAITKENLRKVGIAISDERASHWVQRGVMLFEAYLARQAMFDQHVRELYEEEET